MDRRRRHAAWIEDARGDLAHTFAHHGLPDSFRFQMLLLLSIAVQNG